MTTAEWGVLIGAIGLIVTLITMIVRLTNTLTKLTVTIDGLSEKVTDINCENKKQHDDLFGIAREHGEKLGDHETRIQLIEQKPKRGRTTA